MSDSEDIKARVDIVALIGETVTLKKQGQEWFGLCPFHADTNPSLAVNKEKGTWHCHGCDVGGDCFNWVMRRDNLEFQQALESFQETPAPKAQIVATYDYQDSAGQFLFQVVRYQPKTFKQRHRNGAGEWVWNLKGISPVLYHLPLVNEGIQAGRTVVVVEGEKDADRLIADGLIATTNPMGAGKWRESYTESLVGAKVLIIPDKDPAGLDHSKQIVKALKGKVTSLKVLELDAKDVSEWLDKGSTKDDLIGLARDLPEYTPTPQSQYEIDGDAITWRQQLGSQTILFTAESIRQDRTGVHARVSLYLDEEPLAWSYLNVERHEDRVRLANAAQANTDNALGYTKELVRRDLDKFCIGLWNAYVGTFLPEMLAGDESNEPLRFLLHPYILDGGGTILFAPPGRGKSYSAFLWAVAVDAGLSSFWPISQAPTLIINLERSRQSVRRRLSSINKALGLSASRPILTINARGKSLMDVMPACKRAIKEHGIGFVVLDSISRAGFGDLTENRPVNAIIDALSGLCPTWLALAHTPRANEGHIFGGVHFDAGADLVVQLLSEQKEDGTLGVGWQITKHNDLPKIPLSIMALEFNELGLTGLRKGKPGEFLRIEDSGDRSIDDAIAAYLSDLDSGDATATQIAPALGVSRAYISRVLAQSDRFVVTRKEGRERYYGVRAFGE